MQKEWKINERIEVSDELKEEAGSKLLAELLLARNINTPKKIHEFLNIKEKEITSPYVFCNMKRAVLRIKTAIKNSENIVIYGDFDADGVSSTALMYKTLFKAGAKVNYFIPNREKQGHGLDKTALIKIIAKHHPKLLISVDCGTNNVEETAFLNTFKVDTIITDHHEAKETLPKAVAIINPKADNSLEENLELEKIEEMTNLAGVGVAFKLALAIIEEFNLKDFENEILPLVALGTIADVVPLLGENRVFVKKGLKCIENGKSKGITKLLEYAKIDAKNGISSEEIAFGIAPRINAAGRLETGENALKLLISNNDNEINECAKILDNFNQERQILCEETFKEALSMINSENEADCSCITLYKPTWHIGIIGIVASKIVETYYKPAFLITQDSEGMFRCSARSIEEINLYDVIDANSELFEGYGGHKGAGGFSFSEKKVNFETVKKALNETTKEILGGKAPKPRLKLECELKSNEINFELIDIIKKLEPTGQANPNPIFAIKDLALTDFKILGQNQNHCKISVKSPEGKSFEALWWGHNSLGRINKNHFDIAFYPKINTFNSQKSLNLVVKEIKSENIEPEINIFDHRKKIKIFNLISDFVEKNEKNVTILAKNEAVLNEIEQFLPLKSAIFDENLTKNVKHLIIFDYPPTIEDLKSLIKRTNAKNLHLMNCDFIELEPDELIKKVCSMCRFALNQKDGKLEFKAFCEVNSISNSLIKNIFKLLNKKSFFKVKENTETALIIDKITPLDINFIKNDLLFDEIQNEIEKINEFRKKLLTLKVCEIENLWFN